VAFHNTISVSYYFKRVATLCNCCHILYKMVFHISNDILQPLEKISNWKWHCKIWRSQSGADEYLSLLYMKTCRLVSIYQLFGGTCCIHFRDIPTLKMEAESFADIPIRNNRHSVLSNKTWISKNGITWQISSGKNLLIKNIELRKRNSIPMFNSEFRSVEKSSEHFLK